MPLPLLYWGLMRHAYPYDTQKKYYILYLYTYPRDVCPPLEPFFFFFFLYIARAKCHAQFFVLDDWFVDTHAHVAPRCKSTCRDVFSLSLDNCFFLVYARIIIPGACPPVYIRARLPLVYHIRSLIEWSL